MLTGLGALAVGAAVVTGFGAPLTGHADTSHRPNDAHGQRAGVMPMRNPNQQQAAAAPAGAHLNYYGGHVISNVSVIQVLYGSGPYETEVQNTAAPSIASFYQGVTNSSYYDWLSEYNTTVSGGTQQTIGRGSFVQQIQITPAAANNGSTIDDTNIQAELKSQISAGHLPQPNANTLFAVYFPDGKVITQGGQSSGVQFCAYHGTVAASGSIPEFYYSILPGFGSAGFSGGGCGSGTEFQNVTSVSSHELVEATTDAEVGLATTNGPPLAWYDPTNGEIGDICNGQQQAIVGGDGRTYTVQQEWSNQQNACVVSGPATTNDFSMSVSPASGSVAAGSSTSTTVSTAVTAGSAASVSLSASGLPSGAAVSFNPSSVTAGASSTMTITTSSSTPAGTSTVTVTGVEGSKTHSASYSLTVTSSGGGGSGITNGGFETGTLSGWTATGTTSVQSSDKLAGTYAARLGATTPTNGDSTISQTFTVPSGGTGLTFSYNNVCPDTLTYDWADVTLKDNTTATTTTPLAKTCSNPSSGWKTVNAAVTAGHSYTLTLLSHDDNYGADPTYTDYDAVAITSTTPTNDFSMGASPATVSTTAGGSVTSTISTTTTSGSAQAVSLSASGLPAGAGASFNPASVTSGGSSTLTISTSSSTPAGSYTITITGTGTSKTHTTAVTLSVTSSAPPPVQVVGNPGFETGSASPWSLTAGVLNNSTAEPAHSGTWDAWLDGYGSSHTDSASQTVTIPAGHASATLTFYVHIDTAETTTTAAYDTLTVKIGSTTLASYSNLNHATGYVAHSFNVSSFIGQTVTLTFTGTEDVSLQTSFVLDDITLTAN